MHLFFTHGTMKFRFLLLLLLLSLHSLAAEIAGKVVGVTDGDTITVLDTTNTQYRIRLDRIDAPERRQAFGAKSKQFLSSLIFEKNVRIIYEKKDRYGRILGIVFLGENEINLTMIQHGMAWHYSHYDNTERYAAAEREARQKKIGLWIDPNPISPYIFRQGQKKHK